MSEMWKLMRDRRFILLWLAMLVSATGTFMLLLVVSSHLLRAHGSGLGAASVFAFQWILPVVLASLVRRFAESPNLRRVVVSSEIGGAMVSVAIGLLVLSSPSMIPVVLCFLVRGMFEAVTKTARVVLVKLMFQGPALTAASSTFNLSYYVGGVLGGLLGAALVMHVSLMVVCLIDAATFVFSAGCYLLLPKVRVPSRHATTARRGALADTFALMRRDRALWAAVGYLVAATGVFQGFHNAARTLLPIRHLGLADTAVMQLQMVSGAAIVGGAVLVPLLGRHAQLRALPFGVHALASLALWLTAQVGTPLGLFIAYFGFIFLFEVAFTAAQASMIQSCRAEDMATLSAGSNALGTGLLIGFSLLSGWLSDRLPMPTVALLVAGIGMLWALAVEWGRSAIVTDGAALTSEPGTP
jgi:predicted MFS family arabinose efflux permease